MSLGVILSRCQPLHKGHIEIINKALQENNKVLFIVGSADKEKTKRNPFPIDYRDNMYNAALKFIYDKDRLTYMNLSDLSSDNAIPKQDNISGIIDNASYVNKEWGMYLYYNIVSKTGEKEFTFYYNDDISLIKEWFPEFLQNRITVKSIQRLDNISSSAIRQAIIDGNIKYIEKCIPYWKGIKLKDMMDRYKKIVDMEKNML